VPLEAISATKVHAKIQEFKVAVLDRPSFASESCHFVFLIRVKLAKSDE